MVLIPPIPPDIRTLAVDPGKKTAGVAFFVGRKLIAADLLRAEDPLSLIRQIAGFALTVAGENGVDVLITEGQQVYPGPRRADPNDLLPLAFVCGGVQAILPALQRISPLPRQWKGNIPKEVFTRKILQACDTSAIRTIETLDVPKSLLHNVVDAIGLGLWSMGLVGVRRTFKVM